MIDDLRRCVVDAEKITSDIVDPQMRLRAFDIVLTKLIELSLGSTTSSNEQLSNAISEDFRTEFPVITPTGSTVSNIRTLFNTDWGKKRRSSGEISRALDANGVPDTRHVSTILNRLVRTGELSRIKQNDIFVFWKNPATDWGNTQR